MRLLLAVDSLTTLDILIEELTARSWPSETEVRILSIVEDHEVQVETWRDEGYGFKAVHQEMRRRGGQISALAVQKLREMGIQAEVVIMRGNPAFLIPFAAGIWPADLILIRSHNRSDFRNWLLGSVAKSVVKSSPCSVEIVRFNQAADSIENNGSMRILLPTDGSTGSMVAAKAVAETIWPDGSQVNVVNVINPIAYSFDEIGLLRNKRTDRAHRVISQTIGLLENTELKISGELIAGGTGRQIIDRARSWNANLIVVGTSPRRGWKRMSFGSTSTIVADRAHCSVRLIRHDVSKTKESLAPGPSGYERSNWSMYRLGWKRAA